MASRKMLQYTKCMAEIMETIMTLYQFALVSPEEILDLNKFAYNAFLNSYGDAVRQTELNHS